MGAARSLGADGGVLALPTLSALDCVTSIRDSTAQRLMSPPGSPGFQNDLAYGGVLGGTLFAAVDRNLNVKGMSRRLYTYCNTADHRLHRIAEQTGLDLQRNGTLFPIYREGQRHPRSSTLRPGWAQALWSGG